MNNTTKTYVHKIQINGQETDNSDGIVNIQAITRLEPIPESMSMDNDSQLTINDIALKVNEIIDSLNSMNNM